MSEQAVRAAGGGADGAGQVSGSAARDGAQPLLARGAAAVACAMTGHVLPRAASLRRLPA